MYTSSPITRRSLLRWSAVTIAAPALHTVPFATFSYGASNNSHRSFKERLRGPILSIPTPFTKNLEVDYGGVRNMITRALPYDVTIVSLTAGNSQYASLTYEEILELTRVMVDAAGRRGTTIAAGNRNWSTRQTIAYAKYADGVGASAVQVIPPEDVDEETIVTFFKEVANGTNLPIVLQGNFTDSLLEKLAAMESIVAIKEDVDLDYFVHIQRKFGDRFAIFEGGREAAFLVGYPYGTRAAYSTFATFAPQITQQFWQAVDKRDLLAAYEIVKRYEHPFFDRWSHSFWRATLEHFGVASRYLRLPHVSFNDKQMLEVAQFYEQLGLVP